MNIQGTAWKYGNNVDTDVIIPARFLNTSDPVELGKHCMEDIDKDFVNKVNCGDVIVAGANFGCGSSREHAPISIKAAGISCVIAQSFARIFYRNAINIGLPIIEISEALDINEGDKLTVDFAKGVLTNTTQNKEYILQPFPEFIRKIIASNGLIAHVRKEVVG